MLETESNGLLADFLVVWILWRRFCFFYKNIFITYKKEDRKNLKNLFLLGIPFYCAYRRPSHSEPDDRSVKIFLSEQGLHVQRLIFRKIKKIFLHTLLILTNRIHNSSLKTHSKTNNLHHQSKNECIIGALSAVYQHPQPHIIQILYIHHKEFTRIFGTLCV